MTDDGGERVFDYSDNRISVFPASLNTPKHGKPNLVTSTKYTPLTWLPKSLFQQFRRVANVYFLFVAIVVLYLEIVHPPAPKKAVSKITPLVCVLLWTALKDLWEDTRRRRDDNRENGRECHRYNCDRRLFEAVAWRDVLCGDLIFVEGDAAFPSDLLLLQGAGGYEAFMSTVNLDGETSLKERAVPAPCSTVLEDGLPQRPQRPSQRDLLARTDSIRSSRSSRTVTADALGQEQKCAAEFLATMFRRRLSVRMSRPEPGLADVRGTLSVGGSSGSTASAVGEAHFMPRGCVLRNTAWALGAAVYVGDETKSRMNAARPGAKVSNMQHYLNYSVWGLLVTIIAVDAAFALAATVGYDSHEGFVIRFLRYCVVLYHVIPISLYVAFEFLKLCLGFFINQDPLMEDPATGERALARTADLVEEMGQVDFLFSDKTGTLTANEMVFARCSVGGRDLGDFRRGAAAETQRLLADPRHPLRAEAELFFTCLAACHSCQVERGDDGALHYSGASPDEVALVRAAQDAGVVLCARRRDRSAATAEVVVAGPGDQEERSFVVLHELEFNSDRKRMSIVCKHSGEFWCITKGADNVMAGLLDQPLGVGAQEHLSAFSKQGLRTLVVAMKKVDTQYFAQWQLELVDAQRIVDGSRSTRVAEVSARMETSLRLVGITAVEDRLQDKVPETIATLKAAGIRVWVLTGDKTETAVDIARSCRLFTSDTTLAYAVGAADCEDARRVLRKSKMELEDAASGGLVLDGVTVGHALSDAECQALVYELGLASRACVCCRLSPMQKKLLVELVRTKDPNAITLAVGDGANDVPMIEGAHVGVGIRGKEGAQAVQASDVALSQFRFLAPLLLCHGRRAYMRIGLFLCYYLYKNIALAMADVIWAVQGDFSGTIAYPEYLSMLFNVVFNSWHIIVILAFDSAVPDGVALAHPMLYQAGIQRASFNRSVFLTWLFYAAYHGSVSWLVPNAWYGGTDYTLDGPSDFWLASTTSMTCVVLIVDIRLLLMVNNPLSPVALGTTAVSVLMYFVALFVLGETEFGRGFQETLYGIPTRMFTTGMSVGALFLTLATALSVDCWELMLRFYLCPTQLDKLKRSRELPTFPADDTEKE